MEVAVVRRDGIILDVVLVEDWMCGDLRELREAFSPAVIDESEIKVFQVKKVYQKETIEYYLKGEN